MLMIMDLLIFSFSLVLARIFTQVGLPTPVATSSCLIFHVIHVVKNVH